MGHIMQKPRAAQVCEIPKRARCSVSLIRWSCDVVRETTQNPEVSRFKILHKDTRDFIQHISEV